MAMLGCVLVNYRKSTGGVGQCYKKRGRGATERDEINIWELLNTCRCCDLSRGENYTGGGVRPDPCMGEGRKTRKIRNAKNQERK